MHFVVENLVAQNKNDFNKIEKLFLIKKLSLKENNRFKIGKLKNFVTINHKKTKRNYLERMKDKKLIRVINRNLNRFHLNEYHLNTLKF